jgi:predicted HicB family RNase H-like nuclease
MTYKGYTAALEIDEEAGELFGRVQGTRHIITFQGATVEEARRSFEETIDAYLESCRESGEEPDRPFSGRFVVRISPALHRELARVADRRQSSLNDVASEALNVYAQGEMNRSAPPAGNGGSKGPRFLNPNPGPKKPEAPSRRRGKRA